MATLAIACLGLLAWALILQSKRLLWRRYAPDLEWLGAYKNKVTGERVCGICLKKDCIAIPLIADGADFACAACKQAIGKKEGGGEKRGFLITV